MSEGNIATATVQIDVGGIGGQISGGSSSKSDALLQKILDELKRGQVQTKKDSKELKSTFSAGNFGKTLGRALAMAGLATAAVTAGATAGVAASAAKDYNIPNVGLGYDKLIADGEEKVAIIDEKTGEVIDLITKQEAEQRGILDEYGDIRAGLRVQSDEYRSQTQSIERINGVLQTSEKQLRTLSSIQFDQIRANERSVQIQLAMNELEALRLSKMKGGKNKLNDIGPVVKQDVLTPNMSTESGPRDGTVSTWERLAKNSSAGSSQVWNPINLASYSRDLRLDEKLNNIARNPNVFDTVAATSILMLVEQR